MGAGKMGRREYGEVGIWGGDNMGRQGDEEVAKG